MKSLMNTYFFCLFKIENQRNRNGATSIGIVVYNTDICLQYHMILFHQCSTYFATYLS